MDNTWVKLYRKIAEHPVIKDAAACQILLLLFTKVDKKTGKFTTGRFILSEQLGMNPSTLYKVLKRLEKKYEMVTLDSNNKFTEISLLNWAKYNDYIKEVTQSGNNKVTTKEQQSNTKQDIKTLRHKDNNNILDAKRPLSANGIKKEPSKKQLPYFNILDHLETALNAKITMRGKQCSAIKSMLNAGYTELQIIKTIDYMAHKDDFYSDKGFDMTTVAKQISLYKAQMRKAVTI